MLNPFLTNRAWAMRDTNLVALAQQAKAIDFDSDDAPDTSEPAGYEVINGIAVMSLTGPLMKYGDIFTALFGGSSTLSTKQNLQQAIDDPAVSATLLIVDSPGGMVSGTGDLADTIANSDKPVVVYISDMAASAAYWVASQADQIWCNPTASVGSIGVYCVLEDSSELYKEAGVKVTLVKAGEFKGTGVDGVPITDDAIAEEQREINEVYSLFVNAVAEGRGISNDQATSLATGQMWIASKAQEKGLVDCIGSLDDCFAQLSGEMMSNKISAFKVKAAANKAVDKLAEEVTPVTEPAVETPKAVEPAIEAPVASAPVEEPKVEAPVAPEAREMVTIGKADYDTLIKAFSEIGSGLKAAKDEGFDAGVKYEKDRLASLEEIAGEDPAFVLNQYKLGNERGSAAVAYAQHLSKELKAARAAVGSSDGVKAPSISSLDKREAKQERKSFVNLQGSPTAVTAFKKISK